MTNRVFHDAMYREGNMPVEMVRLLLNGQKISRDYRTSWKFTASRRSPAPAIPRKSRRTRGGATAYSGSATIFARSPLRAVVAAS